MMESSKIKFNKKIEEIEMDEKMKEDINKTMEILSEDEEILNYFDYEQDKKALENGKISEAVNKNKMEIATKMIEEKIDLNTISRITGLTKEELENLKI